MKDGDGVLCFNFRADRVREILGALLEPEFAGFARPRVIRFAAAAGMTRYSDELAPFLDVLFPPQTLENLLGEVVSRAGMNAAPHGGDGEVSARHLLPQRRARKRPTPGEDRIMVPSPKVATYDLQPEMSAAELTDKAVAAIDSANTT